MNDRTAQQHAYAITMAVNTLVTAMGMYAENQERLRKGESVAYREDAFEKLIETNGCHNNSVLSLFAQ